jgi:hypothetical protein
MIEGLSMEEYQGHLGLNATTLRLAHRFKASQLLNQLKGQKSKTKKNQFQLGSLVHEKWMEPEIYASKYLILPSRFEGSDPSSRKKRAATQSTARATGRQMLPETLHLQVHKACEALDHHSEACEILEKSRVEVSCFWHEPLWGESKGRFDLLGEGWVVDLKCYHGGRSESNFLRSMRLQGLGLQLAWYQRGAKSLDLNVDRIGHLIMDTETHQVRMRWLGAEEVEKANENCDFALEQLRFIRDQHPELWHNSVSPN